jgi:hypothetical protein
MPRTHFLTPVQRVVLQLLEEAGAEDFSTIVASVKPRDHAAFARQLAGLLRAGLVEFYREERRPTWPTIAYVTLSAEDVPALPPLQELLASHTHALVTGLAITDPGLAALSPSP